MRDLWNYIKFDNLFRRSQAVTGREAVMRGLHSRKTPTPRRGGIRFQGKVHSDTRAIERRRRQLAKGMLKPNVSQIHGVRGNGS
jgi:hypothetical protein